MELMKSPMGNLLPLTVNAIAEKSGLPPSAARRGVIRSFTRAVTTAPKAPPMTTATARSITLPRSMNCLKPLSISRLLWHSAYAERMPKIVVYQKPTCTTCRQVYAALKDSGVDFDAVDYYVEPIPKSKLIDLLKKMGMKPRQLLRTKERIYRDLELATRDRSDDEIIDLMVTHPDLIQRPIVEKGARAILARPADRLKEILSVRTPRSHRPSR